MGIETIPVAYLCPSKLAIALHRQMLSLMDSHPGTFPQLSMCVRTHRSDHSLVVAYGDDRHIVPLEDARSYLLRILGGHTGRHDEPSED